MTNKAFTKFEVYIEITNQKPPSNENNNGLRAHPHMASDFSVAYLGQGPSDDI